MHHYYFTFLTIPNITQYTSFTNTATGTPTLNKRHTKTTSIFTWSIIGYRFLTQHFANIFIRNKLLSPILHYKTDPKSPLLILFTCYCASSFYLNIPSNKILTFHYFMIFLSKWTFLSLLVEASVESQSWSGDHSFSNNLLPKHSQRIMALSALSSFY